MSTFWAAITVLAGTMAVLAGLTTFRFRSPAALTGPRPKRLAASVRRGLFAEAAARHAAESRPERLAVPVGRGLFAEAAAENAESRPERPAVPVGRGLFAEAAAESAESRPERPAVPVGRGLFAEGAVENTAGIRLPAAFRFDGASGVFTPIHDEQPSAPNPASQTSGSSRPLGANASFSGRAPVRIPLRQRAGDAADADGEGSRARRPSAPDPTVEPRERADDSVSGRADGSAQGGSGGVSWRVGRGAPGDSGGLSRHAGDVVPEGFGDDVPEAAMRPWAGPSGETRASRRSALRGLVGLPHTRNGQRLLVTAVAGVSALAGLAVAGPVGMLVAVYCRLAVRGLLRWKAARASARARTRTLDMLCTLAADLRAGLPHTDPPMLPDPRIGRLTSAAWRLAEHTGAPLADLVERIETDTRAMARGQAAAAAEAAGARATAWLLAALPAGGLVLGAFMGVDPLAVLLHTPIGAACATGAVVLQSAGLAWANRLATSGSTP
ncbi:hypothetical protein J2S43_007428 [Catenuloplanes nepalensis]|uniref:Tight adherence protein B n=1 Tax=Catenuloplanes nepalensis TaxID=587533 RepID=A0ABT9N660_9ACTN|nr:hypothetical protein [Catenuloplanes nepalensis]MDP9798916.1 hypothetical protein [Catenuloplanes nepalensis]